jgi:hypothetical protein
MKIILYGWINHLNFKNEEHNIRTFRAMHNTITQLYIKSLPIDPYPTLIPSLEFGGLNKRRTSQESDSPLKN